MSTVVSDFGGFINFVHPARSTDGSILSFVFVSVRRPPRSASSSARALAASRWLLARSRRARPALTLE